MNKFELGLAIGVLILLMIGIWLGHKFEDFKNKVNVTDRRLKGHQPTQKLDNDNPPKGGSGLKNKKGE